MWQMIAPRQDKHVQSQSALTVLSVYGSSNAATQVRGCACQGSPGSIPAWSRLLPVQEIFSTLPWHILHTSHDLQCTDYLPSYKLRMRCNQCQHKTGANCTNCVGGFDRVPSWDLTPKTACGRCMYALIAIAKPSLIH
jgi:hypothetical protein